MLQVIFKSNKFAKVGEKVMEKIQNTFEHRKPEIIGDFKKSGVMILLSEEGKK